jgi:GABA permease
VNSVVARVFVFYVLSVFLVVCVVPWNDARLGDSPFIAALERIGIPGAADVMNAIVVTAVLSCLNSGIYTASRMLFALARRGDAPKALLEVNARGVPVKAIMLSVSIGFLSVIFSAISPNKVFLFLVNSSGAIALFCYILIAAAELRMRRRLEAEAPERLKLRMWLFPWLTYVAIAAMVAVIVSMAFVADARPQLIPSLISLAIVVVAAWWHGRRSTRAETARAAGRRRVPAT